MSLHVRIYDCLVCHHQEDRDINSGYQIAFRDFWNPPPCEVNKKAKVTKNGVLSRREMKLEELNLQGDFQAQTPLQASAFMQAWGRAD